MKRFTKALSMLLAIVMVVGLLPLSIIAEDIQNTHTVQFKLNYNGAHKIPSQKVADGECAVQPEDVTREGWIFEYWYVKTGDGIQKFDLSQPITEDVTLYARWDEDITYWGPIWNRNILTGIENSKEDDEPEQDEPETDDGEKDTFSVVFNANGEDVENMPSPTTQKVANGEFVSYSQNPTRNGYVFTGWYLEHNITDWRQAYDISFTPITEDITLYAGWMPSVDSDGDGLLDDVEIWYNTDISRQDTDTDGLTDYHEILIVGSNPLMVDSDGNGTNDADEDFDNDGLRNIEEITCETNPLLSDTDIDGLRDGEEVTVYFTNPLLYDTDNDGVSDGKEVELNTDPCIKEDIFNVEKSYLSDEQVTPLVEIELSGEQVETLNITKHDNQTLFPENMPGYLGSAYDFTVEGTFTSAKISFTFDLSVIDKGCLPTIYYYNEEEQFLEELETEINGNVASAVVSHFSTYILLDKKAFDEVWEKEIKTPVTDDEGQISGIDVAFAIDVSGSMRHNSRMSTAKSALNTFLDALTDTDRAGLIKFNSSATVLSELTSDINSVKANVSTLTPDGYTAIYDGLDKAVTMLSNNNEKYGYKMIIVLSDGLDEPSTTYNKHYKAIVESAKNNNIVVYTIGIGTSNKDILTVIAENTGGKYYLATQVAEITDAFKEIQADTVDLTTDFDVDGIPDYFEDNLTSFNGVSLNLDKNNPDCDNDGLLDGDEVVIEVSKSGKVYGKLHSNPHNVNSDGDYYEDGAEVDVYYTDPMIKNVSIEDSHLALLTHDPYYYAANYKKRYDESPVLRASIWVGNNVYGDNYSEKLIYKQALLKYFDTINEELIKTEENNNTFNMVVSTYKFALNLLNGANDILQANNYVDSIDKLNDLQFKLDLQLRNLEDLKNISGGQKADYLARLDEVNTAITDLSNQSDELRDSIEAASKTKRMKLDVSPGLGKTFKVIEFVGNAFTYGMPTIEAISDCSTLKSNLSVIQRNIYMLDAIINTTSNNTLREAARELKSASQSEFNATISAVAQAIENTGYTFIGETIKNVISKCHPVTFWLNISLGIVDFIIPVSAQSEAALKIYGMACAADALSHNLCNYLASGKQYAMKSTIIYAMYNDSGIESINRFSNFVSMRIYGEQLMIDMQNIGAAWLQWLKGVFGTDAAEIIGACKNNIDIITPYKKYYNLMYY